MICVMIAFSAKVNVKDNTATFWDQAPPGFLLQNLDAFIYETHQIGQTLSPKLKVPEKVIKQQERSSRSEPALQRRIDNIDNDEQDSKTAETKNVPYDYDRAYDEFVKKYFDDSMSRAASLESEHDYAKPLSAEEDLTSAEQEPLTDASRKHSRTETCKNITKHHQKCLICKNPRNGETSESCSYNRESSPQSYAYENKKNYRKYRIKPKFDENSREDEYDGKKSASNKTLVKTPFTYKCTMKASNRKVCYLCENREGEKLYKCYAQAKSPKFDNHNNAKHGQKYHKRIHKRTVTYSLQNTPQDKEQTSGKYETGYNNRSGFLLNE